MMRLIDLGKKILCYESVVILSLLRGCLWMRFWMWTRSRRVFVARFASLFSSAMSWLLNLLMLFVVSVRWVLLSVMLRVFLFVLFVLSVFLFLSARFARFSTRARFASTSSSSFLLLIMSFSLLVCVCWLKSLFFVVMLGIWLLLCVSMIDDFLRVARFSFVCYFFIVK